MTTKKHELDKFIDSMYPHIASFLTTFTAVFLVEGVTIITDLYNGNWSQAVLYALGMAVVRAAVKSVLLLLFPSIFKK